MNRVKLLAASLALVLGVGNAAQPPPVPAYDLVQVDLQGQKKVLGTLPANVFSPRVSPDGRKVAFEGHDPEATPDSQRIYVAELADLEKRIALPFTVITKHNVGPVWSPDGRTIAFLATGNGSDALFQTRSDGGIQPLYMLDGRAVEGFYGSNDFISFLTLKGNRDYGIALYNLKTKQITPLIDQPGTEQHSARISPDGRWIAYVSNETGRQEVWLEPLPQQAGKRYRLTQNGGRHPQWSPDGTKLYYDDAGNQLYVMDVFTGAEMPKASEPRKLPISGFVQGDLRRQYDLMPDGRSFVMMYPKAAR